MASLRVFIVDDNFVARHGLRIILEAEEGISIVGEASTGIEAIQCLSKAEADIILMDIRMPDLSGIEVTMSLLRQQPLARVLIMTVVEDPIILASAILAGARGYLSYGHFNPDTLVEALWLIAKGEVVMIPPVPAVSVAQDWNSVKLTHREEEVLQLIATGQENREIAHALRVEEKTVKNHINSIYSKIGVQNRQEAVYYMLHVFLKGAPRDSDSCPLDAPTIVEA